MEIHKMKRVKIMPDGYDPMVAAGPPPDEHLWSEEDTKRCKQMEEETESILVEDSWKPPFNKWVLIIE